MWIVANWKSNKTIAEALDWIAKVGPNLPKNDQFKVVVCPTFSALSEVKKAITVGNFPIMVGSQDLSPFERGAYTGEEPAELLKELVDIAILGHSERRKNFRETDEIIESKAKQALEHNITPLICVRNTETPVPQDCKLAAYEPVWAIGTGHSDTPENAGEVAQSLKGRYGQDLEVLYGGSITAENVKNFINQPNIAGVLVGKASLDGEEFIRICKRIGEGV